MKRVQLFLLASMLGAALVVLGCSSSSQSTKEGQEEASPAPQQAKETPPAAQQESVPPKVDTVNVDVQNTTRPTYEQKSVEPSAATLRGRYSVQVGAYKMADNADRVASLAKERFSRNVYTILDPTDGMYKVRVGDFTEKDDARRFRDEMAQQFPSDYNDAWVAENPQK
jgi:cell division septation protein DedD